MELFQSLIIPSVQKRQTAPALDQTNRHREGLNETRTEHERNAVAFLLFVETVHDDSPFGSSECMNKYLLRICAWRHDERRRHRDADNVMKNVHMPREQLYVPKESSFSISLNYFDIVSQTKTILDTLEGSRIDDPWNMDGNRVLSDRVGVDPRYSASSTNVHSEVDHWYMSD